MAQQAPPHTAKIYAFPKRPRAGTQDDAALLPHVEFASAASGAGWYHQAAVERENAAQAKPVTNNVIRYRRH
jgi:hypothetical protein